MAANPYRGGRIPDGDLDAAIARMEDITAYVAKYGPGKPFDGLGCFNALYTNVTTNVREWLALGKFANEEFIRILDTDFANRYFDALRASVDAPHSVPSPWRVLIHCRADDKIQKLQFATAGVNAHINFDLPAAIVTTWDKVGREALDDQFKSYQQIDQLFADEMAALRRDAETLGEAALDRGSVTKLLNHVSDWTVDLTRDVAWVHARRLLAARSHHLDGLYLDTLSMTAGLASRVILTPF